MQATILTIGDEILIGQVVDTNATYLAAALSEEGITVIEHVSVADSRQGIMAGLDRALQQSDIVLMTGGLGPTKDDITKQVLADYFGGELRLHNPTWKRLVKIYGRYGREANETHRHQCRLPTGAKVLVNERGTAPGLWLEKDDRVVVSMPGVPYEMMYLMENEVMRRLRKRNLDADLLRSVTILTAGEGESTIAERLEEIENRLPENMSLAYLPNLGTVRLRLSARGNVEALLQSQLDEYRNHIEGALGDLVYGYGKDDLASVIGRILQEASKTVATAESCTGGSIGKMITAHPDSSKHFIGGIIAYSNDVKESQLGVPAATLEAHGAVSEPTIIAMAEGVRDRLRADYGIATSGIAGPGGGTPEKPVGTIWIAVATPERTVTKLLHSGKDRERNIEYTTLQALNLLRLVLLDKPTPPRKPAPKKAAAKKPARRKPALRKPKRPAK
ncbi:competence/damage-inducible protein A [Lewinella sp. JB7]|uniref:competence/damage-inducible protein A n=1 Tax=Lewinella sp. JB7 TaxID=2962887 RepID=UPI0020C94F13|nr:competence/damage-inducible protein A [Lewinella sp. JB7]MCP9234645.1 competence/damage-inducible protein A [Lewinella sp. JB7]